MGCNSTVEQKGKAKKIPKADMKTQSSSDSKRDEFDTQNEDMDISDEFVKKPSDGMFDIINQKHVKYTNSKPARQKKKQIIKKTDNVRLQSHLATVGQIEAEFAVRDKKVHKQFGTGSLQIDPDTDEIFVLTCAHIFVNELQPDFEASDSISKSSDEIEYAQRSNFYITLEESEIDGEWALVRLKIPLMSFKIHPLYDKFCKYDIAVATFDKQKLLKECGRGLKNNFWENIKSHIPVIGQGEKKEEIEVVGHTINGTQLVSKGDCELMEIGWIMYENITSYAGQSGAPIYKLNVPKRKLLQEPSEQERTLIGLHIGKYQDIKVGIAMNENLEDWVNDNCDD
ncbi:unnamed protein product [Moneuplotes crassus]|uniref:Uncharacterized protein n=1 Tax=Euplotes crassus TaxID=5936 RepID=A0AAD1U9X5_EUPCR|nr:unnamed protein product [Moneuplotes crassus]